MGDTHSTDITYQLLTMRIPNGSDVVHIGDGGWGFGKPSYAMENARSWAQRIDKLCKQIDVRLFHIIGNHDNPAVWDFPSTENLIFVKSGDVAEFPNGKKALLIGGGISVDRFKRIRGESYWIMETTPYMTSVPKTDFVFSHDCPDHFNHPTATLPQAYGFYVQNDPTLMHEAKEQRDNMAHIWRESGAKRAVYGHFHNSKLETVDGVCAKCLDINELYEFNTDL